ncbi:MAG: hypothetical protein DSZ04_06485 [Sulfurimonas sp.]|nr:MAG: hypothetical protein DSZ04_06485 [Sulfurimonas sp.]
MVYEIFMPQLSDSMDEGKLIKWMVSVNDKVSIGDVIAEVESDKAIMELQCFKNGVVKALYIKEGESAPVGTVIVDITLDKEESTHLEKHEVEEECEEKRTKEEYSLVRAIASPKARLLAGSLKMNIQALQDIDKLPVPSHVKDIVLYHKKRFFTLKALSLIEEYSLDISDFQVHTKQDSYAVLEYIKDKNISRKQKISSFQKALIENLDKSALRAVYHIYDYIDAKYFEKYSAYGVTAWFVKIFAKCMMDFEGFRSSIKGDFIYTSVNAHIAIAMQVNRKLYMPVLKDVNHLSIKTIQDMLGEYKTKVEMSTLNLEEMKGSNFGLSNLGFTGIHRFDAMINQDDSSIAAIGASEAGRVSLTLSLDHRLINGYEAALFTQRVKEVCLEEEFFKEEVKNV